jgi:hypothetical protein
MAAHNGIKCEGAVEELAGSGCTPHWHRLALEVVCLSCNALSINGISTWMLAYAKGTQWLEVGQTWWNLSGGVARLVALWRCTTRGRSFVPSRVPIKRLCAMRPKYRGLSPPEATASQELSSMLALA